MVGASSLRRGNKPQFVSIEHRHLSSLCLKYNLVNVSMLYKPINEIEHEDEIPKDTRLNIDFGTDTRENFSIILNVDLTYLHQVKSDYLFLKLSTTKTKDSKKKVTKLLDEFLKPLVVYKDEKLNRDKSEKIAWSKSSGQYMSIMENRSLHIRYREWKTNREQEIILCPEKFITVINVAILLLNDFAVEDIKLSNAQIDILRLFLFPIPMDADIIEQQHLGITQRKYKSFKHAKFNQQIYTIILRAN